MTNEEAIEILKEDSCVDCACANMSYAKCEYEGDCDIRTAMNMAIKALKAEPCEDAVSRDAVMKLQQAYRDEDGYIVDNVVSVNLVRNLPRVTPKQRMGKWTDAEHYFESSWATCSECKKRARQKTENDGWGFLIRFLKYCPNCGAKMEGESE